MKVRDVVLVSVVTTTAILGIQHVQAWYEAHHLSSGHLEKAKIALVEMDAIADAPEVLSDRNSARAENAVQALKAMPNNTDMDRKLEWAAESYLENEQSVQSTKKVLISMEEGRTAGIRVDTTAQFDMQQNLNAQQQLMRSARKDLADYIAAHE
ncbi:MAG TPA: hypothetical protein VGB94_01405 [Acidobacteriaceae bacterium]